jgi:hypothetical protein
MHTPNILFLADDHFGNRSGAHLSGALQNALPHAFVENDWSALADGILDDCDLLLVNGIANVGTCVVPETAEAPLKAWLEAGHPLLILHVGSAAFWHWRWWRRGVGLRWVRQDDPDGVPQSTHPVRPFTVEPVAGAHPLQGRLSGADLPTDEIYIDLEQTGPITPLLTTTIAEGTSVQAYHHRAPWGGEVVGILPGHGPSVTTSDWLTSNVRTAAQYLLAQ